MKKVISILCLIMFCFSLTACDNSETNENKQTSQHEAPRSNSTQQTDNVAASKTLTMIDLIITVGNKAFSAKLYDNQTMQALVKQFPLTVDMSELNGNEKYYYLSKTLPTASEQPGKIHAGDIMLYGDGCLVVFYETFSSSYNYTRLGYIEDAVSFVQVVGDGNIKVTFDLAKHEKTQGGQRK
ncbi:cyclophilin-like fold protein [Clostridium tagluense]|uniref:cyclophilin-like fold protein n=1 Tax=Clostridium tagluense TaxID=360422 RepID=UPI002161728A|nr:cyclophilin-like fold protein [Clostridium tagluense]